MRAKLATAFVLAASFVANNPAPTVAQERPVTAITDVKPEVGDRSTRLVVECSAVPEFNYYSPDPLTLVLDLTDTDATRIPARINVGTKEVESVRVTSLARGDGRSLARLEVRLASLVPYQVFKSGQTVTLLFARPGVAADTGAAPKAETNPTATARVEAPAEPPAEPPAKAVAETSPVVEPRRQAGPRKAATRINSVSQSESEGSLAVVVAADGKLSYQDFFLGNPDRLVVDFQDVMARATQRSLDVGREPVRRARLAQFSSAAPRVARLVLDLSARTPYRIVESAEGVRIVFGQGAAPSEEPLASMRPAVDADAGLVAVDTPVASPVAALEIPKTMAPVTSLPLAQAATETLASAAAGGKSEYEGTTVGGEKTFTGQPISLDFKDGDLLDIFRLFADISGLNVVVNPGVSGKTTVKLTEVPWDQALDLILKTNKLGYTHEDNVIRIAPLSALKEEEQAKRELQKERQLAGELVDFTKTISYAKADELQSVLKASGALSSRGQINIDKRTNTIILKDLPAFVERAKSLMAELDRSTPQVEIEARIIVSNKTFARDLGVQWGFNQEYSPRFGNTTGLTFPNSLVLAGDAARSDSGVPAGLGGQAPAAGIGSGTRGYAVNLPASGFNSALGVSMGNVLGSFSLDAAITALERQGRARILSTPKVTTQNNQAAEIKQGVQLPIQTNANNTITVTFKDATLTLKVTPQITDAGTVILQVDIENNSPDWGNRVLGIPPINTQQAKTQVLVKDGQTTVIGGIFQREESNSSSKTPFFGDLPMLGHLFRQRGSSSVNNELLIFITPRIVKG